MGVLFFEGLESRRLLAAQLLGDLDPHNGGSSISGYTALGNTAVFWANGSLYGSDGTTAGTKVLGSFGLSSTPLAVINNAAYLIRPNGTSPQLWKTDGTAAGTQQVGTLPLAAGGLTAANGRFFFTVNGSTLYTSDPATAASVQLGSFTGVASPVAYNGAFYFLAQGTGGTGLWRTDGTAAGTVLVKATDTNANAGLGRYLTVANGYLYFSGVSYTNGYEPWRSDGTSAGTAQLLNISSGSGSSYPTNFVTLGSSAMFVASNYLYKSDITGTRRVTDTAAASYSFADLTVAGGVAYATAYTYETGQHVWRTDGTTAGTYAVESINGADGSYPKALTPLGNSLYFYARSPSGASDLYQSNGTVAGTTAVTHYAAGEVGTTGTPQAMTAVGAKLYFTQNDPVHDAEPWVSDGTAAGTRLLADLVTTPYSSDPGGPYPGSSFQYTGYGKTGSATIGNVTYFGTADGSLWKSDGTAAGTVKVTGKYGNYASTEPLRYLTAWNGSVYFVAYVNYGYSVWRSDGSAAGTVKIYNSASVSRPAFFTPFNGALYFLTGDSLVRTTGTDATVIASGLVYTGELTATTNALYFYSGYTNVLWKSDGTAAGTAALAGVNITRPNELTALGNTLYFMGTPGTNTANGQNLYRTDGTTAGTQIVKAAATGNTFQTSNWTPSFLTVFDGSLYYAGFDYSKGTQLWRSDGTTAGTVRLTDTIDDVGPQFITVAGNRLYFLAGTTASGMEPWVSDGTAVGTRMLADLNPGAAHALTPYYAGNTTADNPFFVAPDGTVFATADDGVHGTELYSLTAAGGPALMADINPGAAGSGARPISVVTPAGAAAPLLLFSAADPVYGRELWGLSLPPAVPTWLSAGAGATYVLSGTTLTVTSGTVTILSDAAAVTPGLSVVVDPAARVVFNTTQHLAALTVNGAATLAAGGTKVLRTTTLTVGPAGTLDLNDNGLVYDYATAAGQAAAVRSLIASGRAGGAWTGVGLTSTAAKNRPGRTTTLGFMEASDYQSIYGPNATFAGETLDSTAVVVNYTTNGDANFDGRTDFNDFLRLQTAFGNTNATTARGDFNYDGVTDFNDFLVLQTGFGQTL